MNNKYTTNEFDLIRRESMKQTIAGDKSTVRGSKKSSTLLCARKNPKKKKRNKFGANYNDDGYPHYATTAIDGRYGRDYTKDVGAPFAPFSVC